MTLTFLYFRSRDLDFTIQWIIRPWPYYTLGPVILTLLYLEFCDTDLTVIWILWPGPNSLGTVTLTLLFSGFCDPDLTIPWVLWHWPYYTLDHVIFGLTLLWILWPGPNSLGTVTLTWLLILWLRSYYTLDPVNLNLLTCPMSSFKVFMSCRTFYIYSWVPTYILNTLKNLPLLYSGSSDLDLTNLFYAL